MATAMQYEMINLMLSTVGFAPRDGKGDASTEVAYHARVLCDMAKSGTPLVDVTDVLSVMSNLSGDSVVINREALRPLVKPFVHDDIIPLAWPSALLSCRLRGSIYAMWGVIASAQKPGYLITDCVLMSKGGTMYFALFDDEGEGVFRIAEFATMGSMALASAKNAKWVEAPADRITRKRLPAVASVRFRHIEIDMGKAKPMHKTSDRYKTADTPWHHRRGHWAYYSPDKPLFGRTGEHGWYWRPYTEVGDKTHGEIVQDYSVRASLP